jgi:hypothetical protein
MCHTERCRTARWRNVTFPSRRRTVDVHTVINCPLLVGLSPELTSGLTCGSTMFDMDLTPI